MQSVARDIEIGKRFGRLSVISEPIRTDTGKKRLTFFDVQCECGKVKRVRRDHLVSGKSTSCGCFWIERIKEANGKYGEKVDHPLYVVWKLMKRRCLSEYDPAYQDYGGRGITVCDEWRHDFSMFYEWGIAAGWKAGLQIDRRDNMRGYSPDNCRFVDRKTNCRNKRNNVWLTAFGETKTAVEWSEDSRCRVNALQLRQRIRRDNMTPEEAITRC